MNKYESVRIIDIIDENYSLITNLFNFDLGLLTCDFVAQGYHIGRLGLLEVDDLFGSNPEI